MEAEAVVGLFAVLASINVTFFGAAFIFSLRITRQLSQIVIELKQGNRQRRRHKLRLDTHAAQIATHEARLDGHDERHAVTEAAFSDLVTRAGLNP